MGYWINLILSHCNKDNAYIQIFNRIIDKKNKYIMKILLILSLKIKYYKYNKRII